MTLTKREILKKIEEEIDCLEAWGSRVIDYSFTINKYIDKYGKINKN